MTIVLDSLGSEEFTPFYNFDASEGRMAVVVTLIAILELLRQVIDFVQHEAFAPIYVRKPIQVEGRESMSNINLKSILEAAILASRIH